MTGSAIYLQVVLENEVLDTLENICWMTERLSLLEIELAK